MAEKTKATKVRSRGGAKKSTKGGQDEGGTSLCDDDGTQVDTSLRNKRGTKGTKAGGGTKRASRSATQKDPPVFLKNFTQFITTTCKTGVQGLLAEFDDIKRQTQAIGTTPKIAFDTNPDKNRYKDVFCVDESRVILQGGPHDYIHANWVDVEQRKYICTQGPIASTVDDFWRMIWQERCKSIVMLCNIVECGKKKCEQYWPENLNVETKYGAISVTAVTRLEFEKLMTRTNLTVSDGETSIQVEHIIWNNWPDRGVPSDVLTCFKLLKRLEQLSPTVIHCSAGIGRTGTIVGLDLILSKLKTPEMKPAKDIVMELRSRRHGSVQMDIQYLYIHRVLIAFYASKSPGKEEVTKGFVDNYEALCKQRGFL